MPVPAPSPACELALAGDDEPATVTLGERLVGSQSEIEFEQMPPEHARGSPACRTLDRARSVP